MSDVAFGEEMRDITAYVAQVRERFDYVSRPGAELDAGSFHAASVQLARVDLGKMLAAVEGVVGMLNLNEQPGLLVPITVFRATLVGALLGGD